MVSSFHSGDSYNPRKSQMKALENYLNTSESTSFLIISNTNRLSKGTLETGKKTHAFTYQNEVIDMAALEGNDALGNAVIDAIRGGTFGTLGKNGRMALTAKYKELLTKANSIIPKRRSTIQDKEKSSTETDKNESRGELETHNPTASKNERTSAVRIEDSSEAASNEDLGVLEEEAINEEINEGELDTEYDEISQEEYEKFLGQINKIMNLERDTEKKSGTTGKTASRALPREELEKSNATARLASPIHIEETKSSRGKVDLSDLGAEKENDRVAAAFEKDELAADKRRQFIKTDLAKTEVKLEKLDQALIVDDEINKSNLNEMLENNEISEDAKNRLSKSGNIDEKLLTNMLKENLIDIQAYNKIIKSP